MGRNCEINVATCADVEYLDIGIRTVFAGMHPGGLKRASSSRTVEFMLTLTFLTSLIKSPWDFHVVGPEPPTFILC